MSWGLLIFWIVLPALCLVPLLMFISAFLPDGFLSKLVEKALVAAFSVVGFSFMAFLVVGMAWLSYKHPSDLLKFLGVFLCFGLVVGLGMTLYQWLEKKHPSVAEALSLIGGLAVAALFLFSLLNSCQKGRYDDETYAPRGRIH